MLRVFCVCVVGAVAVGAVAGPPWTPGETTCASAPPCMAWSQLHYATNALVLRAAVPRTLRRPDEAAHRWQLKTTSGYEALTVVKCRRVFGRGESMRWRCYDGSTGRTVVGIVNFEGCGRRHDDVAFTIGSAYFTPRAIPWWQQNVWWLALGAVLSYFVLYPGTITEAALAAANAVVGIVIGATFALPCLAGAVAIGCGACLVGESWTGGDDECSWTGCDDD